MTGARTPDRTIPPHLRTCAVAAPHAEATQAAVRCVERGGNALDAALGAAVTLTVVYPHNTSLGGDLFALVHAPDGTISSVNASGPAARGIDAAAVAARHGATMPVRGVDTVTVPGAVAGLGRIHALGARLPWGVHFDTARELASSGVDVAPGVERAIDEEMDLVRADAGLRAVLSPGERALRRGELLVQPQLARTLTRIAEEGAGAFYRGKLARELVEGLRAHGSVLAEEDFARFEPRVDGGLMSDFRGLEVWTAGPNSQGLLLLGILRALDTLGCDDPLGDDAGLLSALFAGAARDRDRFLADPDAMTESVEALIDPGRWASRAASAATSARACADRTGSPQGGPLPRPGGDTVAVVAADSDGWGVSLIQSLFHSFGSGILHEPTGVIFHDRGAMFSLDPRSANVLGPGKLPAHTLMPVLVRSGGRLRWVNGTMGGRAQPQIHTQLLLRLLDGEGPAAAVGGPRWVVEPGDGSDVALLESGVPQVAREAISERMPVVGLVDRDETVGHSQIVAVGVGPEWAAGSDPRADGSAAVVRVASTGVGPPGQATASR